MAQMEKHLENEAGALSPKPQPSQSLGLRGRVGLGFRV